MTQKRDFYEVLGVAKNASPDEIKQSYRKLARQYHPDVSREKDAEEKFKEISEAYEILSDNNKRARYDQFGHYEPGMGAGGGDPFGFGGFSDIFEEMFGFSELFGSGGSRRNRAVRGRDIRAEVGISFTESAFGVEKNIEVNRQETCDRCGGDGSEPGSAPVNCPVCKGKGKVIHSGNYMHISSTCSTCGGAGKIINKPCTRCQGHGTVEKKGRLLVKIPPGVEDGMQMRVSGEGEGGLRGGPPGDLYVLIRVDDHPIFRRKGNDILCEVPISFPQAALGADIKVPTLYGEEPLSIPTGTQPGAVFRLNGKGVKGVDRRGKGDQFISITVEVPTSLSSKQKELILKLAEESPDMGYPMRKSFLDKMKDFLGG